MYILIIDSSEYHFSIYRCFSCNPTRIIYVHDLFMLGSWRVHSILWNVFRCFKKIFTCQRPQGHSFWPTKSSCRVLSKLIVLKLRFRAFWRGKQFTSLAGWKKFSTSDFHQSSNIDSWHMRFFHIAVKLYSGNNFTQSNNVAFVLHCFIKALVPRDNYANMRSLQMKISYISRPWITIPNPNSNKEMKCLHS